MSTDSIPKAGRHSIAANPITAHPFGQQHAPWLNEASLHGTGTSPSPRPYQPTLLTPRRPRQPLPYRQARLPSSTARSRPTRRAAAAGTERCCPDPTSRRAASQATVPPSPRDAGQVATASSAISGGSESLSSTLHQAQSRSGGEAESPTYPHPAKAGLRARPSPRANPESVGYDHDQRSDPVAWSIA